MKPKCDGCLREYSSGDWGFVSDADSVRSYLTYPSDGLVRAPRGKRKIIPNAKAREAQETFSTRAATRRSTRLETIHSCHSRDIESDDEDDEETTARNLVKLVTDLKEAIVKQNTITENNQAKLVEIKEEQQALRVPGGHSAPSLSCWQTRLVGQNGQIFFGPDEISEKSISRSFRAWQDVEVGSMDICTGQDAKASWG